jgi:chemotaxis methyl-accepting protein methylase
MLIYFDRALQEDVMKKFHSALNPGGFLVLGNVESLGVGVRDKFEEFDRASRIYVKK